MRDCKIDILLTTLYFAATGVTFGIVTAGVLKILVLKIPHRRRPDFETPLRRDSPPPGFSCCGLSRLRQSAVVGDQHVSAHVCLF